LRSRHLLLQYIILQSKANQKQIVKNQKQIVKSKANRAVQ
jgi:hypothetical protein